MASFFKRKPVKVFRTVFRWCRIAFLFAVFLFVVVLTYLHLIGLPGFAKARLLQTLREHGFSAQFSSAYLGWGTTILVENPSFQTTNAAASPRLTASLASLSLDWRDLLHHRVKLKSFQMTNARLQFPVAGTNAPFAIKDVSLRLLFLTNNVARLEDTLFSFHDIKIRVNGDVTNFTDLRWWRPPFSIKTAGPHRPPTPLPVRMGRISDILQRITLTGNPVADIEFSANGADMNSLRLSLALVADGARTPWAKSGNWSLRVACAHPLNHSDAPILQARASFLDVATQWGVGRTADFTVAIACDTHTNWDAAFNLGLTGFYAHAGTNWLSASALWADGNATLDFTNFRPKSVMTVLRARNAATHLSSVSELTLGLRASPHTSSVPVQPSWAYWAKLAPYAIDWQLAATNFTSLRLKLETVAGSGTWQAPKFQADQLALHLYHGSAEGQAQLDIASRQTHITARSDFDPQKITPLLTPAARHWLSQYDWTNPPHVEASLSMILPPWTNRPPDWKTAFRASVEVAGEFTAGAASFRGVGVSSAHSHFCYTNRIWTVPHLHAERPDGTLDLDYAGSDATHEYHFRFDSHLDPRDALPLLPPAQRRYLEECAFVSAPIIHGQAWGRWHQPQSVGFVVSLAATNAAFRGISMDSLRGNVNYTNRVLVVSNLEIARGGGRLAAARLSVDFTSRKIDLTNVSSTLSSDLVPEILGTNTPRFLMTMRFEHPPYIRADGSFVAGNPLATDLHFQVQGRQFHWTNLVAQAIEGDVAWQGRSVEITNIAANIYNTGILVGWLDFHYIPKHGSSFRCDLNTSDVDLSALVKGLSGRAGRIEGKLDGRLVLAASQTTNKATWVGQGNIRVHDALLWDIKIFGVLSPVLNAIFPGAGYSRARSATATFVVTNNGVFTDDLRVESTGFVLLYRGTIGMQKGINATVEADLLRNTPLFGFLLRPLLTPLGKLFEYHISGTLDKPVIQPVFIPKFLMMILRPFHTLKGLEENPAPPKQVK